MKNVMMLVLLLLFSSSTFAQTKAPEDVSPDLPVRGGSIPIPDNDYDGTLATMACLFSPQAGAGTVADVEVTAVLEHTWVGDLVIKVVSPTGTIATVQSRAGLAEPADDGTDCCGDSSDLAVSSPITYSTTNGVVDAEIMGDTIPSAEVVCQDDGQCNFIPNPDSAADSGDLSVLFDGEDVAGDWQFCVGDSGGGDTGNLAGATFNITAGTVIPDATPVPSMNAAGLAILALMIAIASVVMVRRQRAD